MKQNIVSFHGIGEMSYNPLETDLYGYLPERENGTVSTALLGQAFEPEQKFENPDDAKIIFKEDYFDNHRAVLPVARTFEGAPAPWFRMGVQYFWGKDMEP